MTVKKLQAQTGNFTIEGYFQKIAKAYLHGVGTDCRRHVANAIREDPVFNRTIALIGEKGTDNPTHVITLDSHGRPAADSYRGKLDSHTGEYTYLTDNGFTEVGAIIHQIPTQTFLVRYCGKS